jgi:hypothetical protein
MRRYIQSSIEVLERLAQEHWDDAVALAQLVQELAYRSTKRAGELKDRVEARRAELNDLNRNAKGSEPWPPRQKAEPPPWQGTLFPPPHGKPDEVVQTTSANPDNGGETRRGDRVARMRSAQEAKDTPAKWRPDLSRNIQPNWKPSDPTPVRFEKALRLLVQDMKRRRSGAQTVTLEHGQRIRVDGAEFAYRFQWAGDEQLFEGAAAEIIVEGETIPGRIVSVGPTELVVQSERDLGPVIRVCILRIDNTAMLVALADRMAGLAGGSSRQTFNRTDRNTGPFNQALADGVLTNSGPKEAPVVVAAEGLLTDLNDKQREATRAALSLPISYLWGPPGTGKTQTLSAIMRALFVAERRSLVCSNTNQAIDQVLAKLCKELAGDPGDASHVEALRDGWVVRVGAIARDGKLAAWADWVSLDGVAARKTSDLRERLSALEEQALAVERRALPARQILQTFRDLEQAEAAEAAADRSVRAAAAEASKSERSPR